MMKGKTAPNLTEVVGLLATKGYDFAMVRVDDGMFDGYTLVLKADRLKDHVRTQKPKGFIFTAPKELAPVSFGVANPMLSFLIEQPLDNILAVLRRCDPDLVFEE